MHEAACASLTMVLQGSRACRWQGRVYPRNLVGIFAAVAVATVSLGCSRQSSNKDAQSRPDHGSEKLENNQDVQPRKKTPASECTLPRLDRRMQIGFGIRRQPGMAFKAALIPGDSSESGSLRPVFVDEEKAEELAKQAPFLAGRMARSRRSITAGARWIPTCDPSHPFALLRDVELLKSNFTTMFNQDRRNLDQMYRHCGGSLGWIPEGQREGRIVAHHLSEDRSRCMIEIRGSKDPKRERDKNDHVLRVMRSRIVKDQLVFRTLTYRVPEQDWPYLAEVVRQSGESFDAVFD